VASVVREDHAARSSRVSLWKMTTGKRERWWPKGYGPRGGLGQSWCWAARWKKREREAHVRRRF
jgi:hypothetical protein